MYVSGSSTYLHDAARQTNATTNGGTAAEAGWAGALTSSLILRCFVESQNCKCTHHKHQRCPRVAFQPTTRVARSSMSFRPAALRSAGTMLPNPLLRSALRGILNQSCRRRGSAVGPVVCSSDFDEKRQRLMAELGYQTQFKPSYATSTGDPEAGLVAGAKVVRSCRFFRAYGWLRCSCAARRSACVRLTALPPACRLGQTIARCV